MEPLLIARIGILLGGCLAASYTDARTGLILDRITYPMIAAGILLSVWEAQWLGLALGALVFGLGYAAYYAGKLGGGDVKLFSGMAFLLPFLEGNVFLLNALFAACVLAVTFYSAYYVTRYARKGINWKENRESMRKALFMGAAVSAYLAAMALMEVVPLQAALALLLPLLLAVGFLALEKGIRRSFFLKKVSLAGLEEDEVIATEFLDEQAKKGLGLTIKGVFGKKEIEKLKAMGVKQVQVYRNMPPFAPFILLGCIAALLKPDLIAMLFA